jgi:Tfp pilus assembly protein PilV
MSVGVLGATGLQLRGLDANRNAFFRIEATQLASDIVNRIQVNPSTLYGPVHSAVQRHRLHHKQLHAG